MYSLLPLIGLLCVAAITPGPNNLVVLHSSGRKGFSGVLPVIASILLGGQLLLGLVMLGAGSVFTAYPSLRTWIGIGGALYLIWLGASLCKEGLRIKSYATFSDVKLPDGAAALIGFQLLNPKGWVMVLTALAVTSARNLDSYLLLAGLFLLIPLLCLLLWAGLGALLTKVLARPPIRRGVDVTLGALLMASAGLLLIEL